MSDSDSVHSDASSACSDSDAKKQFNTSSMYPPPDGYDGPLFAIRNDYPAQSAETRSDHPWLDIDFTDGPAKSKEYIESLLDYCFDGMPECDFVPKDNKNWPDRWYHAPWMHYHIGGREPIHGLTDERSTPPKELAATQSSWLQNWACGYYNSVGATVFSQIWKDPDNPSWSDYIAFPEGSAVFKILLTDATDDELPFMAGSPTWKIVKSQQPNEDEEPTAEYRNTVLSSVRLFQVDVAARDERSNTGWFFGTFIYDGRGCSKDQFTLDSKQGDPLAGWRRLLPVGLMWGNDPTLTQTEYTNGSRPVEHWINPLADVLFQQLDANRYWWGWNGRMNGPADNFISACLSCHSVAQKVPGTDESHLDPIVPPWPTKDAKGQYIPVDDDETMKWFRNLKDEKFKEDWDTPSADYSLQLMIGFNNYERWLEGKPPGRFNLRIGPRPGRPGMAK